MARRQKKQATDTTVVAAPPPPTQLPSPGSPVYTAENFAEFAAHGDETFDPEALAGETSAVEEAASAAAEEGASTAEEAGAGTAAEEAARAAAEEDGAPSTDIDGVALEQELERLQDNSLPHVLDTVSQETLDNWTAQLVLAYSAASKNLFKSIRKEAATQHKLDALQKCTQKYKLLKQREIVLLRQQLQTQAKLLEDEQALVITGQQQLRENLENEKALVISGQQQLQTQAQLLEDEKALVLKGKQQLQESDKLLQQERLSHHKQNDGLTKYMKKHGEDLQKLILEHTVPSPVSTDTV